MRSFTAPLVSVARAHHASSLTARNCRQSDFFRPFIFTRAPRLLVDSCHFSRFLDSSIKVVGADYANEVFKAMQHVVTTNSTFTRCVFLNCHADNGGAIYFNVLDSTLSIERCSFLSCSAENNGGACHNEQWAENGTFSYCCFVKCTVGDSSVADKAFAAYSNSQDLTIDYVTCRDCDRAGVSGKLFANGANKCSSKQCNLTSGRPLNENWGMECFLLHFVKYGDAVFSFHHVEGMRFQFCYDIGLEGSGVALRIDHTDLVNIGFDVNDGQSSCFHAFNENGCSANRKLELTFCNVYGVTNMDSSKRHFYYVDTCDHDLVQSIVTDCRTGESGWLTSTANIEIKPGDYQPNDVNPDNEEYCAYETKRFTESGGFTETHGFSSSGLFSESERFTSSEQFRSSGRFSESKGFTETIGFTESETLIPSSATNSEEASTTVVQPDVTSSDSAVQSQTSFVTESSVVMQASSASTVPMISSASSNEQEPQSKSRFTSESASASASESESESGSELKSKSKSISSSTGEVGSTSQTVSDVESTKRTTDFAPDGRTSLTVASDQSSGVGAATESVRTAATHDIGSSDSGGLSGGQIAGIVIGVIAFIAIIVIVIVVVVTRRKRQSEAVPDDGDETEGHETDAETIPIGMVDFNSTAVTANNAMFDGEASSDPFRDDLEESVLD